MIISTPTMLTPHFSVNESRVTSQPFANIPDETQKSRILNTAYNMEIVRACLLRKPITVNSWFRSAEVNRAVGGSNSSEHLLGAAVDFVCPSFGTPKDICKSLVLYSHILNYNQLIYEGTWVHISFPEDGIQGKREVLTYTGGKYISGIL